MLIFNKHIYRLIAKVALVVAALLAVVPAAFADAGADAHSKQRTLLIIDSYYENDPWSNSIIIPLAKRLSAIDSVHCEIVHLNNCLISDSASYQSAANRVFDKYRGKEPQYLVMIGNTAFTLRDRIKAEWGDVPILLIARSPSYGPLDYYFSNEGGTPLLDHPLDKIRNLRDDYNFTMIVVPDKYGETVDMMMRMVPDMEELLFFADPMYHNRNLSYSINNYLAANYPTVKYRWVVGNEQNAAVLREYLIHKHPHSGLLLSTWFYKPDGETFPTVGEINLISSSVNPIFALRQSYIELGAIGGVYCEFGAAESQLDEVLNRMLAGESMQDVPFFEDDRTVTLVNYPIMRSLGIPEDLCPEGTTFVDKPPTYWERNRELLLVLAFILVVFVYVLIRRTISQRRQSQIIKRQINFVNNMPVPFAKALVQYNGKGQVRDVSYTIMNDAFKDIIRDNAVPDNPYLLFPAAFISEKVAQLVATHEMVMFAYHFDNTDTYYEFIICEVSMPDKKMARNGGKEIDIFAIDITHRYKMEADLKKTTEKLNITLNVAKMTAWQWDVKGNKFLFDNQFHTTRILDELQVRTIGDKEIEIDANDYMSLIHPDDLEMISNLRNDLMTGAVKDFTLQYRILRNAERNEYDWVEINGVVTDYFIDASPKTITGSFLSITDRKEQEQRMADAITRANESDQLKSAFLANMSHEIRTPLNAIIGFSNLLTETDDPAKKREFSEIINRNNDLLLSLVNDVLDLAKIESNTIDINYSAVDLNELMSSIEGAIKLRVQKGVILNPVLGADDCQVVLDTNRVQQVLINLLSNACKFTHRGSISFGYEIDDDQHIYFFVKDTGIGMSPEQIESAFQRFYKADNFTQGTGLGLAICKSLVEKMHGEIGAKSRGVGKGTTFWFTLPYQRATEAMALEQEYVTDNFELSTIGRDNVTDDGKVGTILVAEDNDSNYRLIEHLLTNRFRLLHAHNGIEAIDMFRNDAPDLIIMDINMPEMDGYTAVKVIRQESSTVPIIGVTAYAYASDRKRILSSGFNDYVAKPINPKLLYDAIDRFIKP